MRCYAGVLILIRREAPQTPGEEAVPFLENISINNLMGEQRYGF